MSIRHIIFDCDGVLVDSEPLSMRVDVEILAENGIVMSADEAHHRFVGKTFAAMIEEMEAGHGTVFPPGVSADKDRRLLALYAQELKPVDGVADALSAIAMMPYSVASNSPRERVAAALALTGLTPFFGGGIVTYEDVREGKPEPDVFIEAAHRAGYPPAQCLVIEDSLTGVTAAHRAGCPVLGFTGTHGDPPAHAGRLIQAGAAHAFAHMRELPALVAEFVKHGRSLL